MPVRSATRAVVRAVAGPGAARACSLEPPPRAGDLTPMKAIATKEPFFGSFFYAWSLPMKRDAKAAETAVVPAIIVFGPDEGRRPHASWFPQEDALLAERAASLMGMKVLRVTSDEHRTVASALPAGRVFASGKGLMPFCAKGLYDRLTAFEGAFKPEAPVAAADPLPEPGNVPATWSEIGIHSIVLAADGESPGWFEAIVVEAKADLFGLRWLTWPDLPPFVRRGEHLSLMSAASLEAMRGQAAGEP